MAAALHASAQDSPGDDEVEVPPRTDGFHWCQPDEGEVHYSTEELGPWRDPVDDQRRAYDKEYAASIRDDEEPGAPEDQAEEAAETTRSTRPPVQVDGRVARQAILLVLHHPFGSLPDPPADAKGQIVRQRHVHTTPKGHTVQYTLRHDGGAEGRVTTWVHHRRLLNSRSVCVRQEISQPGGSSVFEMQTLEDQKAWNRSGFQMRQARHQRRQGGQWWRQ